MIRLFSLRRLMKKTAIIIALKRMDRKDIITLVAVPGDENHPSGPI